jgi:transcriptional regulator with PAS, ATPase and Fis domain
MHVVVSWIGNADIRAMEDELARSPRSIISEPVGSAHGISAGLGPVKTLLANHAFDKVYLLSNFPQSVNDDFVSWLGQEAEVRHITLADPTDYGEIFTVVDREMESITKWHRRQKYDLSILLSPGTPAMAAVWVLLGKTKYPARFYQTFREKASIANIPFDLTLDFVPKLLRNSDRALQHLASKSPHEIGGFEQIAGDSQAIRLAVGKALKAAIRDVPVLLTGESGTGKEMFARAIHEASPRRNKPFLAINCASIPKQLMESELFGHEKGAFTGADRKREGAFQQAHGGTLFLDEVGETDLDIQSKLLRVLQPPAKSGPCVREFYPLGSSKLVRADVRIIAATNRDLMSMIQRGDFREDLFYRLAVIVVRLPALRDRRTDIPKIASDLMNQINHDFGLQEPGYEHKILSDSAKSFMSRHRWPGNVRELYNALLQAAVMSEAAEITDEDLSAAIAEMPTSGLSAVDPLDIQLGEGFILDEHLASVHRNYLKKAMEESAGVKTKAARLLGLANYQTLDARLKKLKVQWQD